MDLSAPGQSLTRIFTTLCMPDSITTSRLATEFTGEIGAPLSGYRYRYVEVDVDIDVGSELWSELITSTAKVCKMMAQNLQRWSKRFFLYILLGSR